MARALFAFDEVAWLRDEAVAAALRAGVTPAMLAAGAVLIDLDRTAPALGRLARHPRVLAYARERLGEGAAPVMTRLAFNRGRGLTAHGDVAIALDLDGVAVGRARAANQGDDLTSTAGATLTFIVDFHGAGAPVAAERDDCLWPQAHCVAG